MKTVKVVLLTLLAVGFAMQSKAQKSSPFPVFGFEIFKKNGSDTTKKKSFFRLFHPAFLRLGTMGGIVIPFDKSTSSEVGGTMGLRAEYGFSNLVSLVGEVQVNGRNGLTFPSAQTSLGINLMPFKSKRIQPYVGVSFGVGGGGGNDKNNGGIYGNNGGKDGNETNGNEANETYTNGGTVINGNDENGKFQAFGQMRLGLNYVIAKKFISIFETGYQLPFNNLSTSNGGLMARIGFAYQFGKLKK